MKQASSTPASTPPAKRSHPNRIPFEGVLTRLGEPSDVPPSGSRQHRVLLTHAAAEDALDTLIGMAVNFVAAFDKHDARNKCGVITHAEVVGDELRVRGHIYGHDFPEVARAMRRPGIRMGMSYDMVDVHVANMRAEVYELTKVTFSGAAILLASKAAYRSTLISLSAAAGSTAKKPGSRFTGRMSFLAGGSVKLVN